MVSVIVPLADERYLKNFLVFESMPYIKEVIILNNTHKDVFKDTTFNRDFFKVFEVKDFNHGMTRNFGAKMASGNILLFMTQDALPLGNFSQNIVESFFDRRIKVVCGRQIGDGDLFEIFEREILYPDRAKIKMSFSDFGDIFVSDVCLAVEKDAFFKVGGYPAVPSSEDIHLAYKILKMGYWIFYNPYIRVLHYHSENIVKNFMRWFDVGSSFSGMPWSKKFEIFAFKVFLHLLKETIKRKPQKIPELFLKATIKYMAFKLGLMKGKRK